MYCNEMKGVYDHCYVCNGQRRAEGGREFSSEMELLWTRLGYTML